MNRIFFLLVLFVSANCFGQKSLRDSLFSGKLKADSALVAKSKIAKDTTTKKVEIDPTTGKAVPESENKQSEPEKPQLKFSDNNKTWKKFVDEYTKVLNTEIQESKRVKKGDYIITLEYEIGTDGLVSAKSITCDPKSEGVIILIQERMMPNAPQLAPMVVNGAPRKSSKRQILVLTKDKN